MRSRSTPIVWLIPVMMCVFSFSSLAQEHEADAEIKSEVPELAKFHSVIYKIWHTAWPKKDVTMLKALLPEVELKGGELCKAVLPGILREKKGAWTVAVDSLKSIMSYYRRAAEANDSQQLLDAAEQLHRHYEEMVKLIRPPLKELDDFHSALYPLYHYYKPQKDLEKTQKAVQRLVEKMQALDKAVLPNRLKEKEPAFAKARVALSTAMDSLQTALTGGDWASIESQIDNVHTRYEELSRILE
jgi:hypothetical protein